MKLYSSPLSPFARKCRIVALELGLADRVSVVAQAVSPIAPDAAFQQGANPLGKIPALELDDGRVLFDSHVICEFLCALGGDGKLVPTGDRRWDVLTHQALASGMTDALILWRYETALRPEGLRWAEWSAGQRGKFEAGLAAFEAQVARLAGPLDLAQIALACALAYADARFPDLGWRERAPGVANWHGEIEARPHFAATAPTAT